MIDGGNLLSRRLLALLLAAAILISSPHAVYAEMPADTGNEWQDPTLPDDAIPWDEKHPELLDDSMLYAKSAILIEESTGEVLYEKNADEILYPASTTKIMTCYIALQMADLKNDIVTISQNAIDLVPPTYATIPVRAGERVPMYDLIAATMVRSGNEGANAIAEYLSAGSMDAFADLMNRTAEMLGCSQDTHFTNPSGVHDPNHYTTVRDMAIIARAAMKNPDFRKIVSSNTYEMPATEGEHGGHPLRTLVGGTHILNPEESHFYRDATGVKTGFTNAAGYCFVGSAERGGIKLLSVVFYSSKRGRWSDTKKLMEYGFTQVESISPESLYAEDPRVINVTGFSLEDENHGELTLGIRAADETKDMIIVGNSEKIDLLRENFNAVSSVRWTREFIAPINVGDVMGILTFHAESGETAEYELVATRAIAMRENAPLTLEQIRAYTAADENPWPRFTWDLLVPPVSILLILLWLIRFIRRHRKKRPKAPDIKPIKPRYLR